MTVLVTGGAGFIGSNLIERLLAEGREVVCVDDFNDYYAPDIKWRNLTTARAHPRFTLAQMDILDMSGLERLFAEHEIDAVVHLAARAGVRPSLRDPFLYEQVNVQGTLNLLDQSRRHGINRFIFASSSSVYGADCPVPFREDVAADRPISPYAATKRAAELLCYTYHTLYALPITCLRLFTVFGPRQRPDLAIHSFTRAIAEGREIALYGDGESSRDYTYVTDIVAGFLAALDRAEPLAYEVINLGNSTPLALRDLIRLLENALGREARIRREPDQPGDVPRTYASIIKAQALLDWSPEVRVEDGIERFVEWFRNSSLAPAAAREGGRILGGQ
jgi:UDP-glucuronate 4-epimerase